LQQRNLKIWDSDAAGSTAKSILKSKHQERWAFFIVVGSFLSTHGTCLIDEAQFEFGK
jgi:hypothetical protein